MTELWTTLAVAALSAGGVGVTRAYASKGLLDVPNHRSSHAVPTPRGGGLPLILVVVLAATAAERSHHLAGAGFALVAAVAGLALLGLVGWIDDHRSASVAMRLPVHVGCGLAVAYLVAILAPVPGLVGLAWLAAWTFWTVASINIVNFMDGVDGMVATQGVVYGLYLRAVVPSGLFGAQYGSLLAAACVGFLLWNWAPARIFMGDVGSGPLGMLLVAGGAFALGSMRVPLVFVPLFPLYFDALATLIMRRRRKRPLTEAHRWHLYQRVANAGIGHAPVTSAYGAAAALGALIAWKLARASPVIMWLGIAAYVATVVLAWFAVSARFPLDEEREQRR